MTTLSLESPPQLAARFKITAATVRRRLHDVTPDRTVKRQDGTVIRLYNPTKVRRHLAKRDRPTGPIDDALLDERTIALRLQNDRRDGLLIDVVHVISERRHREGELRRHLDQLMRMEGPAALSGNSGEAALAYGRRLMAMIEDTLDRERDHFANGSNAAPKLDLRQIITNTAPIPEAKTRKDHLALERLRRLRQQNATLARGLAARRDVLASLDLVRKSAMPDVKRLLLEEYPKLHLLELPDARSRGTHIFDDLCALFQRQIIQHGTR